MSELYKFLSGNVPGGIGLYLLVVITFFLVLYSISRGNELFTRKKFLFWYSIIWVVATGIYITVWLQDPPETVLHRYSTLIYAEEPEDAWLAYYFRDGITSSLKPYRSKTNYLYYQRWNYLADLDCTLPANNGECQKLLDQLPIDELIVGELVRDNQDLVLHLKIVEPQDKKIKMEKTIPVIRESPLTTMKEIRTTLSKEFPLLPGNPALHEADSLFVLARDYFFKGKYDESQDYCSQLLSREPNHQEAQILLEYCQIRKAEQLKAVQTLEKDGDDLEEKPQWEVMLENARRSLIPIFKETLEANHINVLMANMIAESFMLQEKFDNAEEFLKIAYSANPFDIDVLENLSLLHPSRYKELGFIDEKHLLRKILMICPIHERVLQRYAEKLLISIPVDEAERVRLQEVLQRFLELNPQSEIGWILWGKYQLAIFQYREAIKAFQKADSLQPRLPVVQYNLGVTHFKLKNYREAEHYFKRAIEYGDYLDAHLYLGVIYQKKGDYQSALKEFRYRVANKTGEDDYYAIQAMKGIRECLEALNIPIPKE
ncbi:MAG: tetratricopeptide repeat protein [Calditrichaeota bacterium]|nr:MAG: tetratricopeptide repeat protein [Calditrichota bacterium]